MCLSQHLLEDFLILYITFVGSLIAYEALHEKINTQKTFIFVNLLGCRNVVFTIDSFLDWYMVLIQEKQVECSSVAPAGSMSQAEEQGVEHSGSGVDLWTLD